jgi:hypothetical protein
MELQSTDQISWHFRKGISSLAQMSTLGFGGTSVAPGAYALGFSDTAFIGFIHEVSAVLWPKSDWEGVPDGQIPNKLPTNTLADHEHKFFAQTSSGATAQGAIESANLQFPAIWEEPQSDGTTLPKRTPMILSGDQFATLKYVYLTEAERAMRASAGLSLVVWWVKL